MVTDGPQPYQTHRTGACRAERMPLKLEMIEIIVFRNDFRLINVLHTAERYDFVITLK